VKRPRNLEGGEIGDERRGAWTRGEPFDLVCVRLPLPVAERLQALRRAWGSGDDGEVIEKLVLGAEMPAAKGRRR